MPPPFCLMPPTHKILRTMADAEFKDPHDQSPQLTQLYQAADQSGLSTSSGIVDKFELGLQLSRFEGNFDCCRKRTLTVQRVGLLAVTRDGKEYSAEMRGHGDVLLLNLILLAKRHNRVLYIQSITAPRLVQSLCARGFNGHPIDPSGVYFCPDHMRFVARNLPV